MPPWGCPGTGHVAACGAEPLSGQREKPYGGVAVPAGTVGSRYSQREGGTVQNSPLSGAALGGGVQVFTPSVGSSSSLASCQLPHRRVGGRVGAGGGVPWSIPRGGGGGCTGR